MQRKTMHVHPYGKYGSTFLIISFCLNLLFQKCLGILVVCLQPDQMSAPMVTCNYLINKVNSTRKWSLQATRRRAVHLARATYWWMLIILYGEPKKHVGLFFKYVCSFILYRRCELIKTNFRWVYIPIVFDQINSSPWQQGHENSILHLVLHKMSIYSTCDWEWNVWIWNRKLSRAKKGTES